MRKYRIVKNVVYILMAFCLLCGCQDSTKYPTKSEAEVLWPSQEELSVLSDGSLAEVDLTHANDGYICARLLQETSGIKLQISKDDKKYNYDL